MFEQTMLLSADASRRAWTTGLGFAGQAALVGLIAAVPLIWPEAMPRPQALLLLLTPPAPVAPAQMARVTPRTAQTPVTHAIFDPRTMPTAIPKTVAMINDVAPEVPGAIPGVVTAPGVQTGLIDAIVGSVPSGPAPPREAVRHEAPVTTAPAPPRIRTSSLELARVIHQVQPIYPTVAKLARVEGAVELTGVIGIDGHIKELKALSGNPLLIRAAIDAVSQWLYAPPALNGVRVEVIAPITVNFTLNR